MDPDASPEQMQTMTRSHQDVIQAAQKILFDVSDPLRNHLNVDQVQKIHSRFLEDLLERQRRIEKNWDDHLLENLSRSIMNMHINTNSPLNLTAPLKAWRGLEQSSNDDSKINQCWKQVVNQYWSSDLWCERLVGFASDHRN